jgi:hypothetical protein
VKISFKNSEDAPICITDGSIMVRTGSCYTCQTCATTTGCS